jgi:hypothetical protein
VFDGLKKDAQIWEHLLWTSGGLLELSKCHFYIIYWKFANDGSGTMMSTTELTPSLLLTEGKTHMLQEVKQLDLDDAFKTLGIHKTIFGNQSVQIEEMTKKSNAYARGILSVNISHFEACTGIFTIWLGQLNYPGGYLPDAHRVHQHTNPSDKCIVE